MKSALEEKLALQIKAMKLPPPTREFKFDDTRKWKADFAWPEKKLLVEVEGGTFSYGRHQRPLGFTNDCEKYNAATLAGYALLRFTRSHIQSGNAIETLKNYFNKREIS